ncbi:uncharacterized protein LOC131933359, partial [Physella acuta]|uniref:uncharacterized protein LOC131933359 n=1 Tax=Physella acuta TaxID=109671 RepID=UPI0027DABBB8
MKSVNCANKNLDKVPSGFPVTTEVLALQVNLITKIEKDDFKYLTSLRLLFVFTNRISIIHPDSLLNMHKLEQINLTNNQIKIVSANNVNIPLIPGLIVDLTGNNVESINDYTMFNVVGAKINLLIRSASLQCSCALLTIRERLAVTFSQEDLQSALSKFTCVSGTSQLSYLTALSTHFEKCSGPSSSKKMRHVCRICTNVKDFFAFSKCPKPYCDDVKTQCLTTLKINSTGVSFSSGCGETANCYRQHVSTFNECRKGLPPLGCVVCCRNPDCSDRLVRDRLVKYTVDLIYNKYGQLEHDLKNRSSDYFKTTESRISVAIRPLIDSKIGFVETSVRSFEEIPENNDEYHVRLKLEVTTIAELSFQTVLNEIRENISVYSTTPNNWFSREVFVPDTLGVIDPNYCPIVKTKEQSEVVTWPKTIREGRQEKMLEFSQYTLRLTRQCIPDGEDAAKWGPIIREIDLKKRRKVSYVFWASIKALDTFTISAYFNSVEEGIINIIYYYNQRELTEEYRVTNFSSNKGTLLQK